MKNYFLISCFVLIFHGSYGQNNCFDFYGNCVPTIELSSKEVDTLASDQRVPHSVKSFIGANIERFGLEDWSVVLFLNKFVSAQFSKRNEVERVRILATLLAFKNINNAI